MGYDMAVGIKKVKARDEFVSFAEDLCRDQIW
jgi:hypothetical protein